MRRILNLIFFCRLNATKKCSYGILCVGNIMTEHWIERLASRFDSFPHTDRRKCVLPFFVEYLELLWPAWRKAKGNDSFVWLLFHPLVSFPIIGHNIEELTFIPRTLTKSNFRTARCTGRFLILFTIFTIQIERLVYVTKRLNKEIVCRQMIQLIKRKIQQKFTPFHSKFW